MKSQKELPRVEQRNRTTILYTSYNALRAVCGVSLIRFSAELLLLPLSSLPRVRWWLLTLRRFLAEYRNLCEDESGWKN